MYKSIISKKNISIAVLLFINFAYILKYSARFTELNFVISMLVNSVLLLIVNFKQKISFYLEKINKYFILVTYLLVILILFHFIPKEALNIDRWSVITSFWDNFFSDKYVYYAKSFDGNNPGPMPFYFIVAWPFYKLGEIGLFGILGVALYIFQLYINNIRHNRILYFLMIASSGFLMHEIVCRSNIFANAMLVVLLIYYFQNKYNNTLKSTIIFGILTGLIMSTRNVFAIPFIIMVIFYLKSKLITFCNVMVFGFTALIIFALTFLPFIWNHFDDFLITNPFIIQSDFLLPMRYSICFVVVSFAFGFMCKNKLEVYFYSGILLFLTIAFYHILITLQFSFQESFYGSVADITYFLLCIPFFIQYILSEETKKSL